MRASGVDAVTYRNDAEARAVRAADASVAADAEAVPTSMRYQPWFLLFVLTLVGTINWADRQVVPILFPGIRADLHLSDTELGVIGGVAFSLVYAMSAFVFGRAADRSIRRNIVAVGLVFWSLATAAGAFATGFGSLFAARFFTGIGEATLYPAAMSLLAERFPVGNRGRAMGIFGSASALGAGLGVGLGGTLAETLGWRNVFLIYGGVGFLLLPLLLAVPEKRRTNLTAAHEPAPRLILSFLRDARLMSVWAAGTLMMAAGFGYSTWIPSFFVRERGMEVSEAGQIFGVSLLIGGVVGSVCGGMLADRARKHRLAGDLDVSALAGFIAAPLAFATLVVTWIPAYVCFAIMCPIAVFAFFPSIQTVILEIVPAHQRGFVYALHILFLAGVGIALGPYVVGAVSDAFGLRVAMFVPVAGMLLASLMSALAGRIVRAHTPRPA